MASIRSEGDLTAVRTHVSAISSVVNNVTSSTQHFVHKPETSPLLRDRAAPMLETLEYHRSRLIETAAQGEAPSNADELRECTNRLPPIAFEIARETKELVQRLEPMSPQHNDD